MRTEKTVLWVEDRPDLLIASIKFKYSGHSSEHFLLENFLNNVDWAFCIDDAQKKLSENKYSLHILDANLPQSMSEERKNILANAIENGDRPNTRSDFYDACKTIADGYVFVYDKIGEKDKLRKNVIMLSSSNPSIVTAYALKIPFYHTYDKSITDFSILNGNNITPGGMFVSEKVQDTIIKIRKERYKTDEEIYLFKEGINLDKWEHGGIDEFVNKYILKK